MTKQPTRGHISVKGTTYLAFRDACEPSNRTMGRVLDGLILAALDDDQVETAYWTKWRADRLEAIKTKTWERAQAKKKADHCYHPAPVKQTMRPEEILAGFHHMFGMPGPVASILPNEIEPQPQGKPGSVFSLDDPSHVEVTPQKRGPFEAEAKVRWRMPSEPIAEPDEPAEIEAHVALDMPEIRAQVWDDGGDHRVPDPYHVEVTPKPLGGLFSERGLAAAAVEAKAAKASPKREARGTEHPEFHEIKSCIDPTFGKKR